MSDASAQSLDQRVRGFVYAVTMRTGRPPSQAESAAGLAIPLAECRAAFQRLANAHALVLQGGSGDILMANPFSAVPTTFLVELESFNCYGNCIWDALGIAAMLHENARVSCSCGDCGEAMSLSVEAGRLQSGGGIVHFALPARRWWEDIVFN